MEREIPVMLTQKRCMKRLAEIWGPSPAVQGSMLDCIAQGIFNLTMAYQYVLEDELHEQTESRPTDGVQ